MIKRLILILFLIPNFTNAAVIINEVAWMGSRVDSVDSGRWQYYEWIELYNNGNDVIDLTGWTLSIVGKEDIIFKKAIEKTIPANGYYFIERNGYHAFADISADLATSFGTGLSNSGATLLLKDAQEQPMDSVDGSDKWKIGGGDIIGNNTTKETAQRTSSGWITATGTPKAVNASITQNPPLVSQPQNQTTEPEPTSDVGSESWPVEPQIFANAGKDKIVIVGADVYFSGQALGIEKEPLEGVRFLWNFGDGAFKEGQNISHIYKYPGEYIVALDVSSGKYSASDYALVKAVPSQIKISEANKDFIKLSNESNVTLDISGWFIRLENKTFKFPASTLIKANSTLIIPSSNSGLEAGSDVVVELLYSNASKAFSWQKKQQEPAPTTVVGKNDYNSKEKENIIEDKSTSSEQTASVITVGKKDFWTPKKWWGLIILIGILSGAGFLFIRHKTTVPKL